MNGDVIVTDLTGRSDQYDHIVMASHADQTLKMLADPSAGDSSISEHSATAETLRYFIQTIASCRNDAQSGRSWNYIGCSGQHE